ncbi:NAD(P)H-hydrate dehydratase [bacterium]|nr:NAD(P)H-hydrate dehydratase [bacterium]MBU1984016.1 NAD(P)H-hydrate dehydratase [bacterium]
MLPLLTSDQMRALDAHAIDEIGIPGIVLMENAARAVVDAIEENCGDTEFLSVAVLGGPGNNGGDGFAIARQLYLRGADVDVFLLGEESALTGDALANYNLLKALELFPMPWDAENGITLDEYDVVVDALFGTGAVRAPEGIYLDAVQAMNDCGAVVVAVDVPTGVDASTGRVPGEAVLADFTVTFQCAKCGQMLPPGRDYAGNLIVVPISIPEREDVLAEALFALPEDEDVLALLPPRPREAHKGFFGNLLVIAGSLGMSGAARLAGLAALRCGTGLVKVAVPDIIRPEVAAFRAELMTIGLPETSAGTIAASAIRILKPHFDWADAIAIGPGLGTDPDTGRFVESVLKEAGKPLVIDADGLNLIAQHNLLDLVPAGTILTPHPGEFDRLLGRKCEDFIARAEAARNLTGERELVVALKGAPTVCYDPPGLGIINPTGNPGLATAGSGDVLTGMIAGFLAQGLEPHTAAWVAAYLHGRAADLATEDIGEASLVAADVIAALPAAFSSLRAEDMSDDDHPCTCGRCM